MNCSLFLSELSNKELRMYDLFKKKWKNYCRSLISIIQELQFTQLSDSHSPQHHYQLGSICKTALALTPKVVSLLGSTR